MILLEIKSIKQVKPIKCESKDLSEPKEYQRFATMMGSHPNNPEYGSIILSTRIVSGEFDDIEEVLFIGDDSQIGKLINYKKQLLGGHIVEIQFDTIFVHGLKYSTNSFIQTGGALIGLTSSEKESLTSIETQRKLLKVLAQFIIPSRKELILNFAKVGFLCSPNDENDSNGSHYIGKPKHNKSEITDGNGNELFHLATFNKEEFQSYQTDVNVIQNLSFYLKISDTENGWPEDKNDFKILPIKNGTINQNIGKYEKAINFDIKPILDLPGYDHSLLNHYNFSDEERERYDALRSVYGQFVWEEESEEELNKFLGYPDNIQNCVSYEAERIFNKRDYSDQMDKDAINWHLLLQVSPYCKWFKFFDKFGDGSIFFMIRKDDLEANNFTNCQLVVQNT